MALSARATAQKAAQYARATEQRKLERKYDEDRRSLSAKYDMQAAVLQERLGDVASTLDLGGSLDIARRFPTQLCLTPGIIDECVMNILKPVCTPYNEHNNEMVVEVCYPSGYTFYCPCWIQKLKGRGDAPPPPGCKSWYHVVNLDLVNLNDAFAWTRCEGAKNGATLRLTKLSPEKVEPSFHPQLRKAHVLLLVDGVEMEEPTTQPRGKQRRVD